MAKIYKITAYIVDVGEIYKDGEDWFSDAIQQTTDAFCPAPIEHETAEIDEWHDSLVINTFGCTKEDCEKYFKEKNDK